MSDLHPDVVLAIQHREERQRREEAREREPEVDLKAELRGLSEIVSELCAHNVVTALHEWSRDKSNEGLRENTNIARDLHERAAATQRRLR